MVEAELRVVSRPDGDLSLNGKVLTAVVEIDTPAAVERVPSVLLAAPTPA